MSFRSIFWGISSNYVSLVLIFIGNFIQSAFVIRYLSASESGVWFLFLSILVVIGIFDFGLSPTLSREIGFASYKKDLKFRLKILYSTVRKLVYFLSFLVVICLIILYFTVFKGALGAENFRIAYFVFSVGMIVRFQSNPSLAIIYGLGNVSLKNLLITVSSAFNVFIGSFVLWAGFGLLGVSITYLLGYIILYFLSIFFIKYHYRISAINEISFLVVKRIIYPCYQWTVMNLGAILILQLNMFIIALVLGVKPISHFAVIKQISSAILTFAGVLSVTTVPYISINFGKKSMSKVHALFEFNAKFSTLFAAFIALFVYFNSLSISHVWLGKSFIINRNLLAVMLVTTVLEVHHVACARACMAAGYVKFAGIAIIAGVINIVLSVVLLSYLGLIGVAYSILFSQLLTNNWYVVLVAVKQLQFPIKSYAKLLLQLALYTFSLFLLSDVIASYKIAMQYPVMNLMANFLLFSIAGLLLLLLFKKERSYVFLKIRWFLSLCGI